ncbi:hypothetical protein J6590_102995 [Homalodisca vitripennis]|nr:hypothetical protein J6590_021691 [Homalodisca vitripennis]KAG8279532.1 hypothetical protein J6590_102995 [Homalodisca vitripennis]
MDTLFKHYSKVKLKLNVLNETPSYLLSAKPVQNIQKPVKSIDAIDNGRTDIGEPIVDGTASRNSSRSNGEEQVSDNNFEVLMSKRNRRSVARQPTYLNSKHISRPKSVLCTKTEGYTMLKTAMKRSWIFISRLDLITNSDNESHISSLNVNNYVCEEVKPKYDTYKSFKIGVGEGDFQTLLDPAFWDEGVLVNKYVPPRRNNSKHFLA